MSEPHLTKADLQSAVGASRELGPDYDAAIAANLAKQVELIIDTRVAQGLASQGVTPRGLATPGSVPVVRPAGRDGSQLALAIVSIVLSIPLTAIALSSSLISLLVVWIGIVAVNFAYGRRHG